MCSPLGGSFLMCPSSRCHLLPAVRSMSNVKWYMLLSYISHDRRPDHAETVTCRHLQARRKCKSLAIVSFLLPDWFTCLQTSPDPFTNRDEKLPSHATQSITIVSLTYFLPYHCPWRSSFQLRTPGIQWPNTRQSRHLTDCVTFDNLFNFCNELPMKLQK